MRLYIYIYLYLYTDIDIDIDICTHTHIYDMSRMSEGLDVPAEHSTLYYLLAFSTSAL